MRMYLLLLGWYRGEVCPATFRKPLSGDCITPGLETWGLKNEHELFCH